MSQTRNDREATGGGQVKSVGEGGEDDLLELRSSL
jgi:hypothetical protein